MSDAPACQTAPNLAAVPRLAHGFCGRTLNVSDKFAASPEQANKAVSQAVRAVFNADRPLALVSQVHSSLVHTVIDPKDRLQKPKADALVTNLRDIALGIVTADCAPVLLADPEAGVVAAAHAGWRGAVAGILAATLAAMQQIGAEPHRVRAAIGPTISGMNYQVGSAFQDEAQTLNPDTAPHFFVPPSGDQPHFDLPGFLIAELERLGIADMSDLGVCTYAHNADYFSHRRATHTGEAQGRQIALIGLNPI